MPEGFYLIGSIEGRESLERLAEVLSEKLGCIVSIEVHELPEADEEEESDEDA